MHYKFLNSLFLAANSLIAATTFTACTMDEPVNVTQNKIVLGVTDHNIYGGHEAKTRGVTRGVPT